MKNLISVGSGLVYKFHDDQESRIIRLKELDIEGIELCIADADALLELELSTEAIEYLKSLKYVTIHSPWISIRYSYNEKGILALKKLEELYIKIGAKNVIIHDREIDDYEVFKDYNFNVLIENDDYKFPETASPQKMAEILDENPNFGFNFDFAHALTLGSEVTKEFIDKLSPKIRQIHMSNLTTDIKDHNFLHRDGTPETLDLLKYLKDRIGDEIPFVLECVAHKEEEIDLIKEEMRFLKNF